MLINLAPYDLGRTDLLYLLPQEFQCKQDEMKRKINIDEGCLLCNTNYHIASIFTLLRVNLISNRKE